MIKKRRAHLGLTQKKLAEMLTVSQQTIARWERGAAVPSKYLKDLAVVLGCSVSALVGGGEPTGSLAARFAARREDQESREDDGLARYGTLRLVFRPPGVSHVSAADPEQDDERLVREYPITEGERRRLWRRLDRRDDRSCWLLFDTLDNRIVYVNRSQLELFETVGDDVEAMPSFEHEEIYRALVDPRMRDILEGVVPLESLDAEQAPYSRTLAERCIELAEEWGGIDGVEDRVSGITIETLDGRRRTLFSDPQEDAYEEMSLLGIQLDSPVWHPDETPVEDWMVELGSEGYYRSTRYRLGSLRLIEVPLQASLEASRQAMGDEAHEGGARQRQPSGSETT